MFLRKGAPAPPFSYQAEVNDRPVSLQAHKGGLLLIFGSYQTAATVGPVIETVRRQFPRPEQVLIAGVADLRPVPRLLRGAVRGIIQTAYQEAAKKVPQDEDPADHILILSDWDGDLFRKYQVPDTSAHPALVYIDKENKIAGSYHGDGTAQAALDLINGSVH